MRSGRSCMMLARPMAHIPFHPDAHLGLDWGSGRRFVRRPRRRAYVQRSVSHHSTGIQQRLRRLCLDAMPWRESFGVTGFADEGCVGDETQKLPPTLSCKL